MGGEDDNSYFELGLYYDRYYQQRQKTIPNKTSNDENFDNELITNAIKFLLQSLTMTKQNKIIKEALPKVVILWLDTVEKLSIIKEDHPVIKNINKMIKKAVIDWDPNFWYTVILQLISRILVPNKEARDIIVKILTTVFIAYPDYIVWYIVVLHNNRDDYIKQAGNKIIQTFLKKTNKSGKLLVKNSKLLIDDLSVICLKKSPDNPKNLIEDFNLDHLTSALPSSMAVPIQQNFSMMLPELGLVDQMLISINEIYPVIVNKSVSYSKILKPLKNKILDSFKEVLVYPNFEDINYYKMSDEHKDNFYKGGLWDFTGFEEAFAQNESETLDNSADDDDIKEEIITEEVVVSEVIKDNDDSNNDKGSVLSTGISVFSTGTEQPKNGLKERRTFKDLLKRSTNTFTNDNSSDNHEVEKDTQDVSSNSSNESGAKKVTSKFNTFYQKAKKSASTMIENMKTESETELNDEKEELNKAPVEKEEDHFENEKLKKASVEEEEDHFEKEEPKKAPVEEEEDHFENPFDQIPKLPKRRPLPPIPGDQIAETIRKESIQQSTIDQEVKHDLSTSPVAVTPLVQIEQIQQVEQIQQKVEVQHKEAKAQQDVLTDNKASVTEDP